MNTTTSNNFVKTIIYTHPPKGAYPNKTELLKPTQTFHSAEAIPLGMLSRTIFVDADSLLYKACMSQSKDDKSGGFEADINKCIDKFKGLLAKSLYDFVITCEPSMRGAEGYDFVKTLRPTLCFTGKDNFRTRLYYNYKNNRKKHPSIPVEIYGEQIDEDVIKTKDGTLIINKDLRLFRIKNHIKTLYEVQEYNGLEADDLISIGVDLMGASETVVISSDKDLLTINCYLFNNYESPGHLSYIDEITAQQNFFMQCLSGDQVDCYPGLPGATGEDIVKALQAYGPKTHVMTEKDLARGLRETYSTALGPTAGNGLADANMQCAHLLTSSDLVEGGFVKVYGTDGTWLRV